MKMLLKRTEKSLNSQRDAVLWNNCIVQHPIIYLGWRLIIIEVRITSLKNMWEDLLVYYRGDLSKLNDQLKSMEEKIEGLDTQSPETKRAKAIIRLWHDIMKSIGLGLKVK